MDVAYEPAELDRLRGLSGQRVLLTPNHPTNTEPALLFHLAAQVDQTFRFLACREAFDAAFGLWGHLSRRLGAFSVVRGTVDRASFKATRTYLAQSGAKLVIFPEGEVYSQNDSLLPFHDGAFQLAYWALDDVRRAEPDGTIWLQPVAIKYRFDRDMTRPIHESLERLERFTGASTRPTDPNYDRLRAIGRAMLESLEREYRLLPAADDEIYQNLTPRLMAVKEAILARVAGAVGVAMPRGETLPERMRGLIHAVEVVTRDEPPASSPYDAELRRQQRERALPLLADLARIANWIAVYDGYVRENPTPERMADTLIRLERECFGTTFLTGPRRCIVRLPEPIDLGARFDAYERAKRTEVRAVAAEVERRITAALNPPRSLSEHGTCVPL